MNLQSPMTAKCQGSLSQLVHNLKLTTATPNGRQAMTPKRIKSALVIGLCLTFNQLLAQTQLSQNSNAQGKGGKVETTQVPSFLKLIGNENLTKNGTWMSSKYLQQPREAGIGEIFKRVENSLKNPRLQKGGLDGGSGFVQICHQPEGKEYSIQLRDLFELDQNDELTKDLGPGRTYVEKLDYVFNRIAKFSFLSAQVYRAMAADMVNSKDIQWVNHGELPIIQDIKIANVPEICFLAPAAIQRPKEQAFLPNTKTYLFDRDLFALLDEESKAALILHEIIYRQARFAGQTDSDFARRMVALICSHEMEDMTAERWGRIMGNNLIPINYYERLERLSTKFGVSYQDLSFIGNKEVYLTSKSFVDTSLGLKNCKMDDYKISGRDIRINSVRELLSSETEIGIGATASQRILIANSYLIQIGNLSDDCQTSKIGASSGQLFNFATKVSARLFGILSGTMVNKTGLHDGYFEVSISGTHISLGDVSYVNNTVRSRSLELTGTCDGACTLNLKYKPNVSPIPPILGSIKMAMNENNRVIYLKYQTTDDVTVELTQEKIDALFVQ